MLRTSGYVPLLGRSNELSLCWSHSNISPKRRPSYAFGTLISVIWACNNNIKSQLQLLLGVLHRREESSVHSKPRVKENARSEAS